MFATNNAGANSANAAYSMAADSTAPSITAAVIADQNATLPGFVHSATSYFIYANVSDGGSGVASVTANVAVITTGATTVSLPVCLSACTVNGVTYGFKSTAQTANSGLTNGSKSWTLDSHRQREQHSRPDHIHGHGRCHQSDR